jgi:hypothetical protein
MRFLVFLYFFLFISSVIKSQPASTFNKTYQDTVFFSYFGCKVIETDSFYFTSGSGIGNYPNTSYGTFVKVYKIDKFGNGHKGLFENYLEKDFVTSTQLIKSKNNDGFYLAQPYIVDSNYVSNGFFSIIKLDNNLTPQWQFVLQDTVANNLPLEMFEQNSKIYLFGTSRYNVSTPRFNRLITIGLNGNLIDTFSYKENNGGLSLYRGCLLKSGNMLMAGTTWKFGTMRGYMHKIDSLGNKVGVYDYPNTYSLGVRNFGDAHALMYGYNIQNNTALGVLIKADTNGVVIWRRNVNYNNSMLFNGATVLNNGNIVAVGTTWFNGLSAGYVGCFDGVGNTLWQRTYNNPNNLSQHNDQMSDVIETSDGGILVNGAAQGITGQDLWLVKLDSMGCLEPNCWVGIEDIKPNSMGVQVYPNPATEWLNIKVAPGFTDVTVKLINLSGQLVGQYPLNAPLNYLSVNSLPYGLYLLKFEDGKGNFETQKVFLGR